MTRRTALCLAVICLAIYFLTGCLTRSDEERGSASGVVAGQPLDIKWSKSSTGNTSVEVSPALVSALTAGANATPWGVLITGGLSLVSAWVAGQNRGTAVAATARANEHKADSDEAWDMIAKAKQP